MDTKKLLTLLLAGILTVSSFTACGSAETMPETGENAGAETETAETVAETTRDQIADNLPEKDYEGRNFLNLFVNMSVF